MVIELAARYVLPVSAPPIAHGLVRIEGNRIVEVRRRRKDDRPTELGSAALVPGLINTHTHLEFSDLASPIGHRGMRLVDWLPLVIAHRQAQMAAGGAQTRQARLSGLDEALGSGTTYLAEISTSSTDWPERRARPDILVLDELLGLDPLRIERAREKLGERPTSGRLPQGIRRGLSPHAPYSTRMEIVALCAAQARRRGWPLAMHLAESAEELELLSTGRGPLREFLETLGVWRPEVFSRPIALEDILLVLARAPRALVVHGNYLEPPQWRLLAERADRIAVVYCPRTHDWFDHRRYRLAEMLAAGVRVVIGTDSRASNPDLNLWNEWRWAAARHANVPPEVLLEMVTLGAARALGVERREGSIEPGKLANLLVVRLPEPRTESPYVALLDPSATVDHVIRLGMRFDRDGHKVH